MITHISAEKINQHFDYKEFIPFLKLFLQKEITVPDRSHFTIPGKDDAGGTLLTMPAWQTDRFMGVKIVSVFPKNIEIPSINGIYLLLSAKTGEILASFDGLQLTVKRTAAVSGLACDLLAPANFKSLLMIGTGNLCHELIKAHATVRSLEKVWIWGRNYQKAILKARGLTVEGIELTAVENLGKHIKKADIISTATLSDTALVKGELLKERVYLDLVGSYNKQSREADDNCLIDANIYVDTKQALKESGDLFIPLQSGLINEQHLLADLTELCKGEGRKAAKELGKTYFKSVGFAAPDLAAAVYLYSKIFGNG